MQSVDQSTRGERYRNLEKLKAKAKGKGFSYMQLKELIQKEFPQFSKKTVDDYANSLKNMGV